MTGFTNASTGISGGAKLVVSCPANVSVTVSKGDKSYTKNSGTLGSATFKGLTTGTWTIVISGNGQTATRTIEITADYSITIAFFSATIKITYPASSTCVVTNESGQTVASNTNTDTSAKTWTATVNATGTYTVTATDGTSSKSQSVEITAEGQFETVELGYALVIFEAGKGLSDGFTLTTSGTISKSVTADKISLTTTSNNSGQGTIKPSIDLSQYSTLTVTAARKAVASAYSSAQIRLLTKETADQTDSSSVVAQAAITGSLTGGELYDITIDVSSISDTVFLNFGCWTGASIEITSIKLT